MLDADSPKRWALKVLQLKKTNLDADTFDAKTECKSFERNTICAIQKLKHFYNTVAQWFDKASNFNTRKQMRT